MAVTVAVVWKGIHSESDTQTGLRLRVLLPQAAGLPRSDAGCDSVEP